MILCRSVLHRRYCFSAGSAEREIQLLGLVHWN
jgi:hypothetical protein